MRTTICRIRPEASALSKYVLVPPVGASEERGTAEEKSGSLRQWIKIETQITGKVLLA